MSVGAGDSQALPCMPPRARWKRAAGSPSQCHVGAPYPCVSPRVQELLLPFPRLCWCAKPWCKLGCSWDTLAPGEQLIPTLFLLAATLGPVTMTKQQPMAEAVTPNCAVRGSNSSSSPPAVGLHAHPHWHGYSHVLVGKMPPVPPKPGWLQSCGVEKHRAALRVLGNKGKAPLQIGKVLMGP